MTTRSIVAVLDLVAFRGGYRRNSYHVTMCVHTVPCTVRSYYTISHRFAAGAGARGSSRRRAGASATRPEYERASPQTSRESDENDDDGRAMPGRKGRSSSTCPGLDGGGARGSHLATLSEFRGL